VTFFRTERAGVNYQASSLPAHRLISAVLVLSTLLAACAADAQPAQQPTQVITPTGMNLPAASPSASPVPAGVSAPVENMVLSITGIIRPADGIIAAGDIFNAQAGQYQHYILVTLVVSCRSTATQGCDISPFRFKLTGSDGKDRYHERLISGVEGLLEEAVLKPGETITASLPFIISIGATHLVLTYTSIHNDVSDHFSLP
jgi:hypothetical protein